MRITNTSEQARTIVVWFGEKAVPVAFGRPGALAQWDKQAPKDGEQDARLGEPPDPDRLDLAVVAKAHGVKPEDLIAAVMADPTYKTWRKDGHFAEA